MSSTGALMVKTMGEHGVNSEKAKIRDLRQRSYYANPEPSHGYTRGRCRDYWRGRVLLITSSSAPHPNSTAEGDDIVRRVRKLTQRRTARLWDHAPLRPPTPHVRPSIPPLF